jgi:RNA polymerase sigma-70 factor (ECF subfamily)
MDRLTFSDERLMTLAAGGDQQAFEALVRRMGAAILTVASRTLGNDAAAEEVFVDVVAKLWTGRATYKAGKPVRPWIMAIAANACRERFRRGWQIGPRESFDESSERLTRKSPSPDAALAENELTARVTAALAKLPDNQREVLVLRLWGDLKYEHIAAATGTSAGTARSIMYHALAAMRRLLGSVGEADPLLPPPLPSYQPAAKNRSDQR